MVCARGLDAGRGGGDTAAMACILVIGRTGQLARALAAANAPAGFDVVCHGRDSFDLADVATIGARLAALAPAAVINAAAFNAVDKAEVDDALAMTINAHAVAALARACADAGTPFVHVSTDYVFDGEKGAPYVEGDAPAPINAYGRSKLAGERAVVAAGGRAAVIRTSWVHSAGGEGFVQAMIRRARERGAVDLVDDQLGRPTWAPDLAAAALHLTKLLVAGDTAALGIFHYTGSGDATRADWGEAVLAEAARRGGPAAVTRRIGSAMFAAAAPRPRDTRLDCPRWLALGGPGLRDWREGVARCLADMPLT